MRKYLLRLDDACPTMNEKSWGIIETILDHNGVRPMVGVIPHNEDQQQVVGPADPLFWEKVHEWERKGWTIAMHGYNHCYTSNGGMRGLNPMWKRSEFAGLPLEVQKEKIRRGILIMREHDVNPRYFFAPSHTFDENTLIALREETDVRIISDTIATKPYQSGDFIFVPQFGGQCREMKMNGIFTFCLHPNTMSDEGFERIDRFLKEHRSTFISFDDIRMERVKGKSLFDCLLSIGYYTMRRVKGLY